MKSLEELAAIRNKMKDKVALRENNGDIRIVVGMATCGIAAGAKVTISSNGLGITATTTSGVAEIVDWDGTAVGSQVRVRF